MVEILKKENTKLRVKEFNIPNPLLGSQIDVTTMPEGHLCCAKCHGYKFECWVFLDAHKLEMGCVQCGSSLAVLFPLDVSLMPFHRSGRFTCMRHAREDMILVHNMETICVGCARCKTEVQIKLKTQSNLVLAS